MAPPRRPPIAALFLLFFLAACAPTLRLPGPALGPPALSETEFRAADGARLPLHVWPSQGPPTAILLAVHGFNDYGTFIKQAAVFLARRGVRVYAYDQRGFGRAPHPGRWPGWRAYGADLAALVGLLRARHEGLPLYLLGSSMGGAVIMTAMNSAAFPAVDGVVLVAPAVWGRAAMPFYQRAALWLGAHTLPWLKLSGRGLRIRASDNVEMLRALGRDPLIIKETRIDTLYGLVNLMDAALAAAPRFDAPALVLYGDKDEVIPAPPTRRMLASLPRRARTRQRIARYAKGFHMLLRDLQARTVWLDIAAWMADRRAALPSGADRPTEAPG